MDFTMADVAEMTDITDVAPAEATPGSYPADASSAPGPAPVAIEGEIEPQSLDTNKTRLLILYDQPKYKHIRKQVSTLQEQGAEVLEINEFAGFKDREMSQKAYHYLNICVEYNDEFESNLRKLNEFVVNNPDFLERIQEIGYHIYFDDKRWDEYTEFEKSEYTKFIDTLKTYSQKVKHVSIINKYDTSTMYLTEKNDLTKLGEEIQDDIKYWTNLEIFDYGENCIRFFPGVKFPDSLKVMNISGGYSIEALTGFNMPENLQHLIASNNAINSVDNLKFPSHLHTLNLAENKIYFLNYIEFPPDLKVLELSNNRIDNVRGVDFPELLEYLSISFNPIDNIKGARFPESLKYLDISCIPNDSMTGIKFPDLLDSLNLQESMTNTRGLKLPIFLKSLNLCNNGVNSINPLKLPNTLETLNLCNNNIKTLNKVQFPTNMRELYLGNNLITTLKNVVFPLGLEVLDIEMDPNADDNDKRISSLKDVILPNSLKVLKLGYQSIKVLENFEFPLYLQELDLSYNDLKLIKNIKLHGNLQVLDLSGNQELIEIDQFIIPDSVKELRIPSQLIPNLPGYIVERANSKDLLVTKSLPF